MDLLWSTQLQRLGLSRAWTPAALGFTVVAAQVIRPFCLNFPHLLNGLNEALTYIKSQEQNSAWYTVGQCFPRSILLYPRFTPPLLSLALSLGTEVDPFLIFLLEPLAHPVKGMYPIAISWVVSGLP